MNKDVIVEYKGQRMHLVVSATLIPVKETEDWNRMEGIPATIVVPDTVRGLERYHMYPLVLGGGTFEEALAYMTKAVTDTADKFVVSAAEEIEARRKKAIELLTTRRFAVIDGSDAVFDVEIVPGERVSICRGNDIQHPAGNVVWIRGNTEPYNVYFSYDEMLKSWIGGNKVIALDLDGKQHMLLFYIEKDTPSKSLAADPQA